ncbi:MAG: competence protein ComEA [Actinomycetota bacterium]|nr:competence protein ComEA [Actinomycetota bacterium]
MPPPLAPLPAPVPVVEQSWSPTAPDDEPADDEALVPPAGSAGGTSVLAAFVPDSLRGGRWDPGRRGLPVLLAVAVAAAVVAGLVLLRARPHEVAAPPVAVASAEADVGGVVVVDVAGKVRHPGIVRLPLGSRIDDALRAAGGPLPGATLDGLNRARKLTDGEQVLVGVAPPAGSAASGPAADGRVDLNAADVSALDGLPGIGPVLAQKIVDWRTEHGRFASVDQLREVSGIGESKFEALKNKVRV